MLHRKLLLTIVLLIGLLGSSGCADMQKAIPGIGALTCALGINELTAKFGHLTRAVASLAGGVMCGAVGKELAKYLEKQDYENIATVVDDPKPQKQTWCSGSRGFAVKPTNGCADKNQVTVTTQPVSTVAGKQCRDYLTEVRTPSGEFKTVTANSCESTSTASRLMKPVTTSLFVIERKV